MCVTAVVGCRGSSRLAATRAGTGEALTEALRLLLTADSAGQRNRSRAGNRCYLEALVAPEVQMSRARRVVSWRRWWS
jgi:hypothetical protein